MTSRDGQDGFLDRWSRRKLENVDARTADTEPNDDRTTDRVNDADPPVTGDESEAALLERLNLKNPDELQAGDDFSGFMRQGVPAYLRRKALRKLWLTNPLLANLDELVDYGEDFTDAATVVANLQTSYQVGRGMLAQFDDEELEQDEDGAPPGDTDDSDPATVEQPETELPQALASNEADPASLEMGGDDADDLSGLESPAASDTDTHPPAPIARRRSMRFDFG